MDCSIPGFPVLHYLLEFTQTHVLWVRWYHPTISSFVAPFPPASSLPQHQGLYQWVGSSHQVARVLALQLQHQSFQWVFRVDFLWDWLVLSPCSPRDSQESLPAPQFKASVLRGSVFFMVQIFHPYMTTGKTITLIVWTFVDKVMSVLYNMLPGFVIAFLPRNKHLLIPWL